jgi:SAM-dependent methyltransferase
MIMDMGCGTGNASLSILKTVPARIFLIDGSASMVDIARDKVGRAMPGHIQGYKVADLGDEGWAEGLEEGAYDAIVSTLVLEHLPLEKYQNLMYQSRRLIKPGGWLLAVEGYDDGVGMREWFYEQMEERQKGLDPGLAGQVARLRDEKEVHYYYSQSEKARWWSQAGFKKVHVIWQYLCLALMAGQKPYEDFMPG